MQTIEVSRRQNLAALIAEAGSQAALSEQIGKAPAQISQWLNASTNSKTGKPRVMSNAIAREIEKLAAKPDGWMDQARSNAPISVAAPALTSEPTMAQALEVMVKGLKLASPDLRRRILFSIGALAKNPRDQEERAYVLAKLSPPKGTVDLMRDESNGHAHPDGIPKVGVPDRPKTA